MKSPPCSHEWGYFTIGEGDLVASMAKIGLFQNVWMSQCTVDKTGPLIYIQ